MVFAFQVDAKDDQAEAFYHHHGFVAYGNASGQLVLPLAKFATEIKRRDYEACYDTFIE